MSMPDTSNLDDAYRAIRRCMSRISDPYSDGFNAEFHKKDLWRLKCWLDETYQRLPTFASEDSWEQERMLEILKKK